MLHPDTRAFLKLLEDRKIPPTYTLTPLEARAVYRDRRGFTQPDAPPVASVEDISIDGPGGALPLRSYRPLGAAADAVLPVLVFFHGGGFVIGDLDTHDTLCRMFANQAGCTVVAVDYRLAPEHPYPAAVEDCTAAAYWVSRNAARLKVDAARLALGGDSAGGNLAAVVAQKARDAGDLAVIFQLLLNPTTDGHHDVPSHQENGTGYLLEAASVKYYDGHYLGDGARAGEAGASPLRHANLAGLPPAFIVVTGFDPLRDEGIHYAQRLTEAGSRAAVISFPRQIHNFFMMGRVIEEAETAVAICAAELARALKA